MLLSSCAARDEGLASSCSSLAAELYSCSCAILAVSTSFLCVLWVRCSRVRCSRVRCSRVRGWGRGSKYPLKIYIGYSTRFKPASCTPYRMLCSCVACIVAEPEALWPLPSASTRLLTYLLTYLLFPPSYVVQILPGCRQQQLRVTGNSWSSRHKALPTQQGSTNAFIAAHSTLCAEVTSLLRPRRPAPLPRNCRSH